MTIDDLPAVDGDDVHDPAHRADPKRYSRAALISVIAAREAWIDAGLRVGEPGAGVVIGSGGGGIDVGERQYYDFFVEHGRKVTPYAIPISIVGMMSSEISISLRLRGVSHVLSCGCTSSTDAIGYAAALIRSGEAEILLSGGADACVTPGMIYGFSRMRAVSTAFNDEPAQASRPFDRARDGFVLGEGAWMVVLEREERARARGATIYASIDGYASTCDAYHRVQMAPDGEEIVRAMSLAIERSGRSTSDIGYVSYHGTSTQLNDAVESRCVRQVFGDHADRLAGSSVKSMVGHPQGASGAAGIVTTALAHDARVSSAHHQPDRSGSDRAISTTSPITGVTPRSTRRSATAWASVRRTAPLSWEESTVDSSQSTVDRNCGEPTVESSPPAAVTI